MPLAFADFINEWTRQSGAKGEWRLAVDWQSQTHVKIMVTIHFLSGLKILAKQPSVYITNGNFEPKEGVDQVHCVTEQQSGNRK